MHFAFHCGWVFCLSLVVYLACALQPSIRKNNSNPNSPPRLAGGCCVRGTQEPMAALDTFPAALQSPGSLPFSGTCAPPRDAGTART